MWPFFCTYSYIKTKHKLYIVAIFVKFCFHTSVICIFHLLYMVSFLLLSWKVQKKKKNFFRKIILFSKWRFASKLNNKKRDYLCFKKNFFLKLKIIVGFDLWAQKPTQDFCFPFIFRIGSPPYICSYYYYYYYAVVL